MRLKAGVRAVARWIHHLHDRAYSHWRVREAGLRSRLPLDAAERSFYLELRPALLGADLVVYDVGAASGVVTRCLAKLPNVRAVHAFEPIAEAFEELMASTRPYREVVCHNVALGDRPGATDMLVVKDWRDSSSLLRMLPTHKEERPGATYQTRPEAVEVVRLDDYVRQEGLPPPDVLKIDTQGYEDRVLRGGEQTLRSARFCVLEMSLVRLYEGSPLFDEIYRQMLDLGYAFAGIAGQLVGASGQPLQLDGIFRNRRLD